MPERFDSLTRSDIVEMFDTYARTNSLEELQTLGKRDTRFRRPVFHAMLRQEHLSLRSRTDLDDELKQGILRKYHLFFQFLHRDAYGERIQEIMGAHQPVPDTGPRPWTPSMVLTTAQSGSETVLALVGELYNSGALMTLVENEDIRIPVLVDRADPRATLDEITGLPNVEAAAVCGQLSAALQEKMAEFPSCRNTLASCLLYSCLACGCAFAELHRYYIDATYEKESAEQLVSEVIVHSCPHCGGDQICAVYVLADETNGEVDALLASACLIATPQSRIFVTPPLTVRREDDDRILEVRLSELEEHCESALSPSDGGDDIVMYSLVYTREELETRLSEIEDLSTASVHQQNEQMSKWFGDQLVEEVIRKVHSGVLPLDMAMEHVRRMAERRPDLAPSIPLYSDAGGSPEDYLTAVMVTKAFYEERDGAYDLKALLSVLASEAYHRVGAEGLARTELLRARELRDRAEGRGLTEVVDRLLLKHEAEEAMREGQVDAAIAKFEAVVDLQRVSADEDTPRTTSGIADASNYLGAKNQLGCAYERGHRYSDALRCFSEVEKLARLYAATALLEPTDEDDAAESDHLVHLKSSLLYLESGSIANQGAVCRVLSQFFANAVVSPLANRLAGMRLSDLAAIASDQEGIEWDTFRDVITASVELLNGAQDTLCSEVPGRLLAESIACYARSLEISERVSGHSFAAIQANALYELHRDSGDGTDEELEAYLRKAIYHARKASSLDILSSAVSSLSVVRERRGAIAEAADLSDEALRVLLSHRVASGLDDLRGRFGMTIVNVAARTAKLRHELDQPAKAIEAIESAKCSLLSLELERSSLRLRELGVADTSIDELNALEAARERLWASLADTGGSSTRLLQPNRMRVQYGDSTTNLEAIDARIEHLRRELRMRHPRFDSWSRWSTVAPFHIDDLKRVMTTWRDPARIIGFFVAMDTLWWYNVGSNDVRTGSIELGENGAERTSASLVRIRGRLARRELSLADCSSLLQDVSELLSPAFECISRRDSAQIVICPHNSLLWLAWSMLPVGERLLVESGPIFVVPGLSILGTIRGRSTLPETPRMLVIADPQQGESGALPEAAIEARILRKRFGNSCSVLEGKAATIDALLEAAPGMNFLHFCCHGSFGGFGDNSGRLFLAPEPLGESETGALTCERIIEGLELSDTALVNLAACDSGLVRPDQGTEIDGITRAFLCAGANAVLGSLWPLEDKAARIFSENFYVNMDTTRDPGLALRQTQLACLGNRLGESMANPSNWAGYILIGAPVRVHRQADIPEDAIVVKMSSI